MSLSPPSLGLCYGPVKHFGSHRISGMLRYIFRLINTPLHLHLPLTLAVSGLISKQDRPFSVLLLCHVGSVTWRPASVNRDRVLIALGHPQSWHPHTDHAQLNLLCFFFFTPFVQRGKCIQITCFPKRYHRQELFGSQELRTANCLKERDMSVEELIVRHIKIRAKKCIVATWTFYNHWPDLIVIVVVVRHNFAFVFAAFINVYACVNNGESL